MDSTHASSSTSTRASPLTSSADLVALSQEISRLGTIFNEQEFSQKEKAELRKFFTVEVNQRKDILILISTLTNDREKLNYLKEFLTDQPVASATDLVFVFIDNTNVCEQGKKLVMWSENISKEDIYIDYGRLVNFVLNGRKLGDDPVIAGSPPYMDDTLYEYLKENGFKARKFFRNGAGQEKEVDGEVCGSIADVMERYKRPGTIILLGGDGDYGPRIRRALLKGWTVEIWFWKIGMAPRIKDIDLPGYPELKTIYIDIDPYYKNFMNAYGVFERKKYLEIYGDTVNYESVMTCCAEMGLFCAWCKFDNGSLKMYCNTFDNWRVVKNYMMNKYPQAQEIVQVGDVSH
ncbi:unnamed protein product [Rhizophagus irregularis]|nr:unnamed protein product [Rhizophagus irregularis]CAB5358993.1 unnamed protein product [Rhizophagus irregularis]